MKTVDSRTRRRMFAKRLLAGAALSALTCAPAWAQTAAESRSAATVEAVVVTGSRIRGIAPVGSNLVSVGQDEIKTSPAINTMQLIQQVPQVFNLGISDSSRGQAGGNSNITWGSTINIRGIGPFATLTLIDGHRAVPQGTSALAVDPGSIPTLALERVEIIADGASAIYGSDAVAGVANLILRRNFDGVEFRARYGGADSYNESQFGVAAGKTWDTGQVMVAFEDSRRGSLNGEDVDFYQADLRPQGGNDFRTTACNPGNIVVGGVSYAIPTGGVTPATASQLVAGTSNRCDGVKSGDLLPRQHRTGLAFTFDQELNERLTFVAHGFATQRKYFRSGGYPGSTSLVVPRTNAFFVAPAGTNPASETVQYQFRDVVGSSKGFSKVYQVTGGLKAKLGAGWQLEGSTTFGRNDDRAFEYPSGQNAAALAAALASSNPETALNVFGGKTNPAVIKDIFQNFQLAAGKSLMEVYELTADGPLYTLPGGQVRLAVGYEGQRYKIVPRVSNGSLFAPLTTQIPRFRDVDSVYGEIVVPIVGAGNALPFVQALELDVAGRYDKYSDVGSTSNPKVGVNWTIIDGLKLRGSYGTSFRAPGIAQIYGNTSRLFVQNYSDPLLGGALRVGATLSGGNLALKPETATTWSYGVDWAPAFLPSLRTSLTYFDVEYEGQVTQFLQDLSILNRESEFAGTGIITRNPDPALIAQLALLGGGPLGVLPNPVTLYVDGRSFNLGVSRTKGFDFQASYSATTDNWGDFGANINGTRFTKFNYAITPSAPLLDKLNLIYNPLKLKVRANLSWRKGDWASQVTLNYVNSYTNDLTKPAAKVDAYKTVDLFLSYNIGKFVPGDHAWAEQLTAAIDVTNVFDEKPPFVNVAPSGLGGGGFDPSVANPIGRLVGVSLRGKF